MPSVQMLSFIPTGIPVNRVASPFAMRSSALPAAASASSEQTVI